MQKLICLFLLIIYVVFAQGIGNFSSTDENVEEVSHHRAKRLVHSVLNGRNFRVPYVVYVLKNRQYHCLGIILSPELILTAAKCVFEDNAIYTVYAATAEDGTGMTHIVTHKNIYSPFDPSISLNNLALLLIHPPIFERDFVRRIELYNGTLPDNSVAVLTGWGQSGHELRSVVLETMRNQFCRNDYRILRHITDRDLCAVGNDRHGNGFPGDSGGPLTVAGKLVGVYSWTGRSRGQVNPDVFVNLLHPLYQTWIHGNIRARHGRVGFR